MAIDYLSIFRATLVLAMLSYASLKDLKTREVSDAVWLVFGIISLPLNAYAVFIGDLGLITLGISLGFSLAFSLLSWYLGLLGGADLLALVVLSLLCPTSPKLFPSSFLYPPLLFPLSVISNSVLIGGSSVFVVLIMNLLAGGWKESPSGTGVAKRIGLLLTSRKKRLERISGPPFEYPLEYIDSLGELKVKLRPNLSNDALAVETLQKLKDAGREKVWVTYTLPFLLILLIGFIVTVTLGDFSLWVISSLMKA